MKKQVKVLSLGGSLIVPEKIDIQFLKEFKKVLNKHSRKYKFVVVCGGGTVARKYISALKELGLNETFQSFSGISATRMNARFMNYVFGINPHKGIPHTMKTLRSYLKNQNAVFCGALEYKPNQTSDSTAVEVARNFKSDFINITNVDGLYNKNPKKYKSAKLVPWISWEDLHQIITKIKFKPGQHFVIDQTAARLILKNKIKTYIVGKDLKQLDNLLAGKKFRGTTVSGDYK